MEINTNSQNVVPPYNVIVLSLNLRRKKVLTQATNVMKLEVVCVCVCVCQSLSRVCVCVSHSVVSDSLEYNKL